MKKKLLITSVLFASILLMGQGGVWEVNEFDLSCQATEIDTSGTFILYPYMTIGYAAMDTSGDDSVDITLALQICADTWVEVMGSVQWVTFESFSISSDSSFTDAILTDTPLQNYRLGRWIATGGSDNKKDSNVLIEGYVSGWQTSGRL